METPTNFIDQVNSLIATHISDPQLLDLLSQHFQLSSSQIYRKIKGLTNISPSNYIRRQRLLIAKEMVEQSDMTITEIARRTGFQQLAYFSRCFSEEFGVSASSLRKNF